MHACQRAARTARTQTHLKYAAAAGLAPVVWTSASHPASAHIIRRPDDEARVGRQLRERANEHDCPTPGADGDHVTQGSRAVGCRQRKPWHGDVRHTPRFAICERAPRSQSPALAVAERIHHAHVRAASVQLRHWTRRHDRRTERRRHQRHQQRQRQSLLRHQQRQQRQSTLLHVPAGLHAGTSDALASSSRVLRA